MLKDLKKITYDFISQEKISQDIKLISKIEDDLFPQISTLDGIELSTTMVPAEQIGGDCYDIFQVDDSHTLFYLADVTGHGIPAGWVVGIMNFLIYTLSQFYNDSKEILNMANKILRKKIHSNLFVTTVMCNWCPIKNKFSYVQAGHEQIIHYQAKRKKAYLCPSGGIALGMIDDIALTLEEREIILEEGDVLFLYSDGIVEAWKDPQEMLGIERFIDIIEQHSVLENSNAINQAILNDVKSFMGEMSQKDDISLMVVKKV